MPGRLLATMLAGAALAASAAPACAQRDVFDIPDEPARLERRDDGVIPAGYAQPPAGYERSRNGRPEDLLEARDAAALESAPVNSDAATDALVLPAPSAKLREQGAGGKTPSSGGSLTTMFGSLAVVLGGLFLLIWFLRRQLPSAAKALPAEVVEVLGRAPLAGRQYVHLLRLGNKLLLVSATPQGAETLAEVDDPVEVDRLAGLCMQAHPYSSSRAFRQIFAQFQAQSAPAGFVGDAAAETEGDHA